MGERGCNQGTFPGPNMAPYLAYVRNNVWTCHVDTGVSYRVRRSARDGKSAAQGTLDDS